MSHLTTSASNDSEDKVLRRIAWLSIVFGAIWTLRVLLRGQPAWQTVWYFVLTLREGRATLQNSGQIFGLMQHASAALLCVGGIALLKRQSWGLLALAAWATFYVAGGGLARLSELAGSWTGNRASPSMIEWTLLLIASAAPVLLLALVSRKETRERWFPTTRRGFSVMPLAAADATRAASAALTAESPQLPPWVPPIRVIALAGLCYGLLHVYMLIRLIQMVGWGELGAMMTGYMSIVVLWRAGHVMLIPASIGSARYRVWGTRLLIGWAVYSLLSSIPVVLFDMFGFPGQDGQRSWEMAAWSGMLWMEQVMFPILVLCLLLKTSHRGENLRAIPNRCPECGAVPEAANGAAT